MIRYLAVWRDLAPPARRFYWSSVAMFAAWGIGEVLFGLYLLEIGYALSLIGVYYAVGAAGQVTGALLLGWTRRRIPVHRGLFWGALVEVAGVALIVWWPSPLGVPLGFALHYFGEAAFWALGTAYLAGVIPEPKRALAFGLRWAMLPVFLALGRGMAGFLPGWFGPGAAGFRGALAVCWLLFAVMAWLRGTLKPAPEDGGVPAGAAAAPPAPDPARPPGGGPAVTPAGTPAGVPAAPPLFQVALGQATHTFLIALGITVVLPYMNVIYLRRFGLPLEAVGGAMGLEVFMQTVAILLSPFLAERFRPVRLLTVLRVAVAPLFLVMAWTGSVGWFLAAATVRGVLTMAGMPVVESFWVGLVVPSGRATVGAAMTVAWGLAAIVGSPLGAWLLDRGSDAGPFLVSAAATATAVVWYYRMFARYDRADPLRGYPPGGLPRAAGVPAD